MHTTTLSSSTLHHNGDFAGPMYLTAHTNPDFAGAPTRIVISDKTIGFALIDPELVGPRREAVAVSGPDAEQYGYLDVDFDATGMPIKADASSPDFMMQTVYVTATDLANYLVFGRKRRIANILDQIATPSTNPLDFVARLDNIAANLLTLTALRGAGRNG